MNYDFRKHGAQAVLATLWSVDDKATSTLLKDFYHFLEKGENKSRALNEAKLKYLQQDIKYKAPYYWAALMLNGQDNAIVLKKQNSAKQQTLSLSHLLLIVVSLIIVIILATTFDKKNT